MRRQSDVITYHQLLDCGWSSAAIGRAHASGDLERRHRGVYVDPSAPARPETQLMAACLVREARLGIELHSFDVHGDPLAAAESHRRIRVIEAQGWSVPVYTWDDVWNRPHGMVAEIRGRLARLRG